MQVGDHDAFFEENIALAEKLRLAGCDCQSMVIDNAGHAWDRIAATGSPQRAATEEAMKFMEKRIRAAFESESIKSASEGTEPTLASKQAVQSEANEENRISKVIEPAQQSEREQTDQTQEASQQQENEQVDGPAMPKDSAST